MKQRLIIAAVFVPLLFIVMFFLPSYVFAVVVAIVSAMCAYELLRAIGGALNDRIVIYTVFAAVLVTLGAYFDVGTPAFIAVVLVLMSLLFFEAIRAFGGQRRVFFLQVMISLFGGAIIPYLLSTLVSMKNMQEGRLFVLLPVISAFITDAGAYFAGVTLGKKKAFPMVSPGKTVEGFLGGLVAGVASVFLYGVVLLYNTFHEINFPLLILYGAVGAVFTELGDLAFSYLKREFGIKDFGRLLPGHGGMLDRFDSMVFTAPAMYLLLTILPAITIK